METNATRPAGALPQISAGILPQVIQPVARVNRLPTVDLIRGVALLGILMINIMGFALPHPTIAARLYNLPPESLDFRC